MLLLLGVLALGVWALVLCAVALIGSLTQAVTALQSLSATLLAQSPAANVAALETRAISVAMGKLADRAMKPWTMVIVQSANEGTKH